MLQRLDIHRMAARFRTTIEAAPALLEARWTDAEQFAMGASRR